MTVQDLDLIAGFATFILTLMVYSYLLADNFLYRIAVHILIGAAAGYIAIIAFEEVIIPWVNNTLNTEGRSGYEQGAAVAIGILPIIFTLLLLAKNTTRFAGYSNLIFLHVLLGIGTGIAIIGALVGTVLPLIEATADSVNTYTALDSIFITVGTVATLLYFQYLGRRLPNEAIPRRRTPLRRLGRLIGRATNFVGQTVIAITLGALYAGAILTSLNIFSHVLNEQVRFLLDQIGG